MIHFEDGLKSPTLWYLGRQTCQHSLPACKDLLDCGQCLWTGYIMWLVFLQGDKWDFELHLHALLSDASCRGKVSYRDFVSHERTLELPLIIIQQQISSLTASFSVTSTPCASGQHWNKFTVDLLTNQAQAIQATQETFNSARYRWGITVKSSNWFYVEKSLGKV